MYKRQVYVRLARAAVDHGTLWESDKETIQKFVTFEGLENLLENKGEPIIVVAPHFAGLDAAGIALNLSLIHISEPTRRTPISYAVFCLKKKKTKNCIDIDQ